MPQTVVSLPPLRVLLRELCRKLRYLFLVIYIFLVSLLVPQPNIPDSGAEDMAGDEGWASSCPSLVKILSLLSPQQVTLLSLSVRIIVLNLKLECRR
jgi:hypothetical protein